MNGRPYLQIRKGSFNNLNIQGSTNESDNNDMPNEDILGAASSLIRHNSYSNLGPIS